MTDVQIIHSLQSDGPKGPKFQRTARFMYKKWTGYLFTFGKKHPMLSQEEIKDAYHEALHGVIQSILKGSFQQKKSSISSFLYAIFSNKCLDKIRRITNHQHTWEASLEQITPDLSVSTRSFIHGMMVTEEVKQLTHVMSQLGGACKELILAMEFWGYKPEEVAKEYGYKDGKSASQAKYRCLQELKKRFSTTRTNSN